MLFSFLYESNEMYIELSVGWHAPNELEFYYSREFGREKASLFEYGAFFKRELINELQLNLSK